MPVDFHRAAAISLWDRDMPVACVILHNWDGWNVELSAASDLRYIPRQWMAQIAGYVFDQLAVQRVFARVAPESPAERILRKLGFQREGVERRSSAAGDRAVYSLLRSESPYGQ